MHLHPEIAAYWVWSLEKLKWFGFLSQFLGAVMFLALWWHQDRAWRVIKPILVVYFIILGLGRFGLWIAYALLSSSPETAVKAFMLRSGIAGAILCLGSIGVLIFDIIRPQPSFTHFSPEDWSREKPSIGQWLGLILAILGLLWPFIPNPSNPNWVQIAFLPPSFGVTLTPTYIFLIGLLMAGSKKPGELAFPMFIVFLALNLLFVELFTAFTVMLYASLAAIGKLGSLKPRT